MQQRSTSGDNPHDFEPVTGLQRAPGKFRGRDRLAVELHHHAARRQFLGDKKLRQGTRNLYRNGISIGNDLIHGSYFLIPISEEIGRQISATPLSHGFRNGFAAGHAPF
jgi:hypothetical protein